MLTELREKSQGLMILVLFGMLIFVFIFLFGPQAQGFRSGGSQAPNGSEVATVNGQPITLKEVNMTLRRSANLSDLDQAALAAMRRQSALQLIDQVLVEQKARQMGFAVTKKDINAFIVSPENPDYGYFLNHKKEFDFKRFKSVVTQWFGVSTADYTAAKERELVINRYLKFLMSQVNVSDKEVRAAFDLAKSTWNIEYVEFPISGVAADAAVVDGAGYAKANAEAVKAYYESHQDNYVREKEVRVRRILVRVAKDADASAKKAARTKVDALLAKAKAPGADFEAIAKADSEGYYKPYGGDMNWQSKKNTSPEAYTLYSGLKKGEISAVQDVAPGLWFVKAEDIKPALNQTLEQASASIGEILARKNAAKKIAMVAAKAALTKLKGGKTLAEAIAVVAPPKTPVAFDPENPEAVVVKPIPKKDVASDRIKATGAFSATRPQWDTIPGIGKSEVLAKMLGKLSKEASVVPQVLEVGDRLIVARLREQVKTSDEDFSKEKTAFTLRIRAGRINQLFGRWQGILFGALNQREVFAKFAGGAFMNSLPKVGDEGIQLNEAFFAVAIPKKQPAGSQPSR